MTDPDASHLAQGACERRSASTALTVVAGSGLGGSGQAPRSLAITRNDPSFLTQLIATAAHVPQTRQLRRASPEDAQSSYRAALGNAARRTPSRGMSRVA